MNAANIQLSTSSPPEPVPAKPPADHGFHFHDLLSALNPLQYLPVIGTIYRAATGDVIPEGLRTAGSLVVSGLLGGPIGLITGIAVAIGEKVTGIDPEKILAAQFHAAPAAAVADPPAAPAAAGDTTTFAMSPLGFSPRQLAAYGVISDASGTLRLGDLEGADVLNAIELVRIGRAASAYAANQPLSQAGTG
jgi:hypothetical protein